MSILIFALFPFGLAGVYQAAAVADTITTHLFFLVGKDGIPLVTGANYPEKTELDPNQKKNVQTCLYLLLLLRGQRNAGNEGIRYFNMNNEKALANISR